MTDAVYQLPGLGSGVHPRISPPAEHVAAPEVGWLVADALLGAGFLAAVVIGSNLDRAPRSLEEFFAIRLSLENVVLLTAFGLAWPAVLSFCGLYVPARLLEGKGEWPRLALAGAVAGVLAMVFPLTSTSGAMRPEHALLSAVAVVSVAAAARAGVRAAGWRSGPVARRNVVIVGSGPRACEAYLELKANRRISYDILGFFDDAKASPPAGAYMPCLGGLQRFETFLADNVVDEVRIALPVKTRYDCTQWAIAVCERVGIEFSYPIDTFEHAVTRRRVSGDHDRSTLTGTPVPNEEDLPLKRAFDVVVGLALLVPLALPMALIALAIKATSPGPVLFVQQRNGQNKRRFRMYKFRSTRIAAQPEPGQDQEALVTPVGRLLRRSRLDELPQLWNVLRGDMSIVGPRPILPAEIGRYGAMASLLLSLKPGLTSMGVVEGRATEGFPVRAHLELQYVRTWNLFRDIWILLRTVPIVLRGAVAR